MTKMPLFCPFLYPSFLLPSPLSQLYFPSQSLSQVLTLSRSSLCPRSKLIKKQVSYSSLCSRCLASSLSHLSLGSSFSLLTPCTILIVCFRGDFIMKHIEEKSSHKCLKRIKTPFTHKFKFWSLFMF